MNIQVSYNVLDRSASPMFAPAWDIRRKEAFPGFMVMVIRGSAMFIALPS